MQATLSSGWRNAYEDIVYYMYVYSYVFENEERLALSVTSLQLASVPAEFIL
jgi:hypothetical protein